MPSKFLESEYFTPDKPNSAIGMRSLPGDFAFMR